MRFLRTVVVPALSALVVPALGVPAVGVPALASTAPAAEVSGPARYDDTRELDPATRDRPWPVRTDALRGDREAPPAALAQQRRADPGEVRYFLALDAVEGFAYFKEFRLRGTGRNVQVWVAEDRAFPDGDCRNDLGLTEVTDRQVDRMVRAFDTRIRPRSSRVFSTPPPRDGRGSADFATAVGLPAEYWQVDAAQADDVVLLVDNVRDQNFHDPTSPAGRTFVSGFFTPTFDELLDRNVLTLDVFDWLHRTGATPPDDSADPAYQACGEVLANPSLGAALPHDYEATLAHEYQHLLQHHADPDETIWLDEGLADWAQTLTGYVDPRKHPSDPAADGHLRCFSGYAGPARGGPENSLTQWEDQGPTEVLCDFGAAYSFMEYLHSRFGDRFMGSLHRGDANGLAGVQEALGKHRVRTTARELVRRWAVAVAVDAVLDRNGRRLVGAPAAPFTARSLSSSVQWANPRAYDAPGAPANGSDYVRLRDRSGSWLSAAELRSLRFRGVQTVGTAPVDGWTVQLVAYGGPREPVHYHRLRLDRSFSGGLAGRELRKALGRKATVVAAVVTQEDPDEDAAGAAPYRLEVNGVLQPGGR